MEGLELINLQVLSHKNGTLPLRLLVDGIENPSAATIKHGTLLTLSDSCPEGDEEILEFSITPVFVNPTQVKLYGGPLTIFYPRPYTFWDRRSIIDWAVRDHARFKSIDACVTN